MSGVADPCGKHRVFSDETVVQREENSLRNPLLMKEDGVAMVLRAAQNEMTR